MGKFSVVLFFINLLLWEGPMKQFISVLLCFVITGGLVLIPDDAYAEPEFFWHGQFRINSYMDFRDNAGDNVTGSRLRWRPTVDVTFSESVSLHTQLNIGHINANIFQEDPVKLRHAVIKAGIYDTGVTMSAGLVPISDKFGDTMFSSDWDFNPLAALFEASYGDLAFRAGGGQLVEGDAAAEDDLIIYLFDMDHDPTGLGASVYLLTANELPEPSLQALIGDGNLFVYGARYAGGGDNYKINAFIAGSHLDAGVKSSGWAGKLAFEVPVNDISFGLMGIYASGDKDFRIPGTTAGSFITPMSLVGTTGYWGYTGKLNEQGPTDTRIDDHTVNIDGGGLPWSSYANLGYGMLSVQGKVSIPVNDILSLYLGAGYYASADPPSGQSDYIGTDLYVQGTLVLAENLNLDFGVDYLDAGKGHYNNVATDTESNITTLFTRLQYEY